MTPDEYCQQKAAASGSSFYYSFLFLPPRAPPRDHRALRVLPRGRRRRRRGRATRSSRAPSSPGGAPRSRNLFAGNPQHPVTQGAGAVTAAVRHRRRNSLNDIIDGMEMDLDADALPRLAGPRALLPSRRRRGRPARRRHLRLPRPRARSTTRASLGIAFQLTNIIRDVGEDARRTASTCRWTSSSSFGVPAADILQSRGDARVPAR